MRFLKIFFLASGILLLTYLIKTIGLSAIVVEVQKIGSRLILVLLFYLFTFSCATLAWQRVFPIPLPSHCRFLNLLKIRLEGEAVNVITPWAASLGGEPLKAELLKERFAYPFEDGIASLVINYVSFWLSLVLFVIFGITSQTLNSSLSPVTKELALGLTGGLVLIILAALLVQYLGVFKNVFVLLEKFKISKRDLKREEELHSLDRRVFRFYRERPAVFALAVFFDLLSWVGGAMEMYLVLYFMNIPVSFFSVIFVEGLVQLVRVMTFFIPAALGTQEGSIVLLFSEIGLQGASAISFALIRRLREITWMIIGLLLLLIRKP